MSKSMLIDAAHSEETRVVVVGPNGLEEFDFESASLRTLKGNIYLAKVTRVEPSLQAAFVTYGGNRHGFLPFNEIHPDYYRIPVADREALAAEVAADRADFDEDDDDLPPPPPAAEDDDDDEAEDDAPDIEASQSDEEDEDDKAEEPAEARAADKADASDADAPDADVETTAQDADEDDDAEEAEGETDAEAETEAAKPRRRRQRRAPPRRNYKIQEVVKRGQIMLVQVAKEERGGKGAAMTTYISLAGRYCVLMPNTGKGGGISRKITDAKDRKRLKGLIEDLELPDGMAVIVRTAGVQRTKAEIKRDHEFLLRLWIEIRERTLSSTAPALIYEEASLVKRAIRDVYSRDIDEVLVEGDVAYREAKDFMRSLMPSHARRVQPYKEKTPIFQARKVEARLESLFDPVVRLPSGGYLVVNQTEALVAIDVNSGRSTRERNIEETALKTNLEAAVEVARQLRLRELAGIVVIDFIDMDERRNNQAVERKLKDALKADRARVHVGRMSPLGLIEMSRQRLRPSMFETSFRECEHCAGLGRVRSVESNALGLLRVAEDKAMEAGAGADIAVTAVTDAIVYLLNHKRDAIARIEESYGVRLLFNRDDAMSAHDRMAEVVGRSDVESRGDRREDSARDGDEDRGERNQGGRDQGGREQGGRGRSDRRRGRGGRDSEPAREAREAPETADAQDDGDEEGGRRRRRGRRGGRRRGRGEDNEDVAAETQTTTEAAEASAPANENDETEEASGDGEEKSGRRRRRRRRGRRSGASDDAGAESGAAAAEGAAETSDEAADEPVSEAQADDAAVAEAPEPVVAEAAEPQPAAEQEASEAVDETAREPEPETAEATPKPEAAPEPVSEPEPEPEPETAAAEPVPEPETAEAEPEPAVAAASEPEPEAEPEQEPEPAGPPRTGWWRRLRNS